MSEDAREPTAPASPRQPVTLKLMVRLCRDQACDIRDKETAEVEAKWRPAVRPIEMDRADAFDRIAELVQRIIDSPEAQVTLGLKRAGGKG